MRTVNSLLAAMAALALAGCQSFVAESPIEPAYVPVTKTSLSLRDLPAPAKRIAISVYEAPDLTGQYKERDNVQSLSRAVTQGAAQLLVKTLQDAGERRWFTVLERASLDNLLKERQIVTEMRKIYRSENQINAHVLPPLYHANIIVEGAIVGYDTNTVTGGLGARYLGVGADTKYQQDTVTFTLRAISTKTGEVLTTVTTAKTVSSVALQGGIFRFLKLNELLEAEAGITANEPRLIATQEAIDKAVIAMIVEGAELGVWSFADHDEQARIIGAYKAEKYAKRAPANAENRPDVVTRRAAPVTQTVPARPRVRRARRSTPRRVTQVTRPLPPQTRRVAPRVVTPAPAQPAIRRAVPNDGGVSQPARDVPPAPAVDEPAVGRAPDSSPIERRIEVADVRPIGPVGSGNDGP